MRAVSGTIKIPLDDVEFLEAIKDSINMRYEDIASRKKWKWVRDRADFRIQLKHTTGTINATQNSREITGVGAAFVDDHVGWFFRADGSNDVYQVVGVDTAAQTIDLSTSFAGDSITGGSYELFQYMLGLPPDCKDIDLIWHDYKRSPVEMCSPREFVDRAVSNPYREGKAELVTMSGFKQYEGPDLGDFILGYDFLGGTANDQKLLVYPLITDKPYILHVEYIKRIEPLINDSDEPIIPPDRRYILYLGALADMFYRERNDAMGDKYEMKYERKIVDMESDTMTTSDRPSLEPDLRRYYSRTRSLRRSRGAGWDFE